MEITLDEVKTYLRVSSSDEDDLIQSLIASSEELVRNISRLSDEEWEGSEEKVRTQIRIAVLYTVAYLYEHREEADHEGLNQTLRALLLGVRKEEF
jgi:uncharacterized phage protein (predicted DNA packaging)